MPPSGGTAAWGLRAAGLWADWLTGQPGRAPLVEALHFGAAHARHVGLDRVAGLDLQVGQVTVALGEAGEHFGVEGERGGRVDGIEAVLLVDGLAQDDPPPAV